MHQSQIELIVGCRAENVSGQWIECTISLEQEDKFLFQADLCRQSPDDDFSLYRLQEEVNLPLTAELVLGLLVLVAQSPFYPTEAGFSVSIAGESPSANRAAIRMLDPKVRASFHVQDVPRQIHESISRKLSRLAKYRETQRLVLTLGSI